MHQHYIVSCANIMLCFDNLIRASCCVKQDKWNNRTARQPNDTFPASPVKRKKSMRHQLSHHSVPPSSLLTFSLTPLYLYLSLSLPVRIKKRLILSLLCYAIWAYSDLNYELTNKYQRDQNSCIRYNFIVLG